MMLLQNLVTALAIVIAILSTQDKEVFKIKHPGRAEKFKSFRALVEADFVKLESLLIENEGRFKQEFGSTLKKQAEEFISTVESNPWPDPRLLQRARNYLNHLNSSPMYIPSRRNTAAALLSQCGESIALVREPPYYLNYYQNAFPTSLDSCKQVMSSNYYWRDRELVEFATKNETWTECLAYVTNTQSIERNSYQDSIDNFIAAVLAARE